MIAQGLQRIEAYCANMKECDRLICDYVVTFHSQILQPAQFARCLVAAYPFWPDTLALGTYISADAGLTFSVLDAKNRTLQL